MYNHCNICNILIFFYNIRMKHLKHTYETTKILETQTCNMSEDAWNDTWNIASLAATAYLVRNSGGTGLPFLPTVRGEWGRRHKPPLPPLLRWARWMGVHRSRAEQRRKGLGAAPPHWRRPRQVAPAMEKASSTALFFWRSREVLKHVERSGASGVHADRCPLPSITVPSKILLFISFQMFWVIPIDILTENYQVHILRLPCKINRIWMW
jgi:hypothetical protein